MKLESTFPLPLKRARSSDQESGNWKLVHLVSVPQICAGVDVQKPRESRDNGLFHAAAFGEADIEPS